MGFVLRVSLLLLVVQCGSILSQNAADSDIDRIAFSQRQLVDDVNADMKDIKRSIGELKSELEGLKNAALELRMLASGPAPGTADLNLSPFRTKRDAVDMTLPRDCADIMAIGMKTSGVYTVYIGRARRAVQVYCDMTTDGGGWLVFQRRTDGSIDFQRTWLEYAEGFGITNSEFWLGNNNLHTLTAGGNYELRVDLKTWDGRSAYALYSNFKVASACEKYKLISVGSYCGTAGDSMTPHVGQSFSTRDQDNDEYAGGSCAVLYKGAWWYKSCHSSNLNGHYFPGGPHTSFGDGVEWYSWTAYNYSLKFAEMKIRPSNM